MLTRYRSGVQFPGSPNTILKLLKDAAFARLLGGSFTEAKGCHSIFRSNYFADSITIEWKGCAVTLAVTPVRLGFCFR